ncbi:hypothetical protein QOL99_00875 [Deinococcus sp. MIMF12]|uniref:Uncharacterized protein n=1 Tax=Deinococcus rhizophilus TaxID=3049544 RepID=A0ABT7JG93_9DEIO|nr:hypothetical protein [Deinococcus rhizophilus]MDL2342694.1 hypothetical protein [Deinococcus rhizophilus]
MTLWLDLPGRPPSFGPVNLAALVVALLLLEAESARLSRQRFHRPLASGGFVVGTPLFYLRGTSLLEPRSLMFEAGGHFGPPWHATLPVDADMAVTYLTVWLATGRGRGFHFTEYETFEGSAETNTFWSRAYTRLLGIADPPPPPDPPRTPEQQRIDGLTRESQERWLLPEIERLYALLEDHLAAPAQPGEPLAMDPDPRSIL